MMKKSWGAFVALVLVVAAGNASAQSPRARDLGVPFAGLPGPMNAITDVAGVEVGHVTLVEGDARTGATVIVPRGKRSLAGTPAGVFVFNGTGELTGAHLIEEVGGFFGAVVLTGTLGVGAARDGILRWTARELSDPLLRYTRVLPVVGETFDGLLGDAWAMALAPQHVVQAIDSARGGPVTEGSVGGGTGMACYGFKCGIGTASRIVRIGPMSTIVGALVQANHGRREHLTIAGVPVGHDIADLQPTWVAAPGRPHDHESGSIIVVIATDAPLLPDQLRRLARRATIGLARTGAQGGTGSGDIFLAFTTANAVTLGTSETLTFRSLPNEALDPLFEAVIQSTEEAILNAMVAARDMVGYRGARAFALPHERLQAALRRRGLLQDMPGRALQGSRCLTDSTSSRSTCAVGWATLASRSTTDRSRNWMSGCAGARACATGSSGAGNEQTPSDPDGDQRQKLLASVANAGHADDQ